MRKRQKQEQKRKELSRENANRCITADSQQNSLRKEQFLLGPKSSISKASPRAMTADNDISPLKSSNSKSIGQLYYERPIGQNSIHQKAKQLSRDNSKQSVRSKLDAKDKENKPKNLPKGISSSERQPLSGVAKFSSHNQNYSAFNLGEGISPISRLNVANKNQVELSKKKEGIQPTGVTADIFENIMVSDSMDVDEVLDKTPIMDIENKFKNNVDDAERRAEAKTIDVLESACLKAQKETEQLRWELSELVRTSNKDKRKLEEEKKNHHYFKEMWEQ